MDTLTIELNLHDDSLGLIILSF